MSTSRKRSWPTQSGLWWLRHITIYGPGATWNGRRVRHKAQTRHLRSHWEVVEVMAVELKRVTLVDNRGQFPVRFIDRPDRWHRLQWVPAITPS